MSNYIRDKTKGGCYFLTFNLYDRKSQLLITHVNEFRHAFKKTKLLHSFELNAMVLLPDHVHMLITLSDENDKYANIVACLKTSFSRQIPKSASENLTQSRVDKKERGIWQRRFWEHHIRNDDDYEQHVDYIHYNPVKHGYCLQPTEWEYSTIHKFISDGIYLKDWGYSDLDNNFKIEYD